MINRIYNLFCHIFIVSNVKKEKSYPQKTLPQEHKDTKVKVKIILKQLLTCVKNTTEVQRTTELHKELSVS
ncbi:MAG: hypothetical protein EAZ95_20510 [Bacteroidetes bacterium]|nr:MAG: hypothetical protein EAZ95_20510 [Bacteroidota bacterium]